MTVARAGEAGPSTGEIAALSARHLVPVYKRADVAFVRAKVRSNASYFFVVSAGAPSPCSSRRRFSTSFFSTSLFSTTNSVFLARP